MLQMINCNEGQKTFSFSTKDRGLNSKNVIKLDSGCIRTALSSKGALPDVIRHETSVHKTLLFDETKNSRAVNTIGNNPIPPSEEDVIKHGSILKEHCLCCTPWSPVCGIVCASFHEITFEPDPRSKLVRDFGIGKFQVYIDMDDVVACALVTLPDGPLLDTYFGFNSHHETNAYTSSTSCLPLAVEAQPNNLNVLYHDVPTFFQVMVRPPSLKATDTLLKKKNGESNEERNYGHRALKENVEKTADYVKPFLQKNDSNFFSSKNAKNGLFESTLVEPTKRLLDIARSQSLPCLHGAFFKNVDNTHKKDGVLRRKLSTAYFLDLGPYSRRFLSSLTLRKKKNSQKSINREEKLVLKNGLETKRQSDPEFYVCHQDKNLIEKTVIPQSVTDVNKNVLTNVKTSLKTKEKKTFAKENIPQYSTFLFRIHNPAAARQLTRFTMEVVDARKKLLESNQHFGGDNAVCNSCMETLTSLPFDSNKVFDAFLLSADAQAELVHDAVSYNLTQHITLPSTILSFKNDESWKPPLHWFPTKPSLKETIKKKDIFLCSPILRTERLELLSDDTFYLITNDMANSLAEYMPPRLFLCSWKLGYCTKRDGLSFSTFFRCLTDLGPCVFFICDTQGTLFGAFCSVSVYESSQYYGNGECFVFSFKSGKLENMATCQGETFLEQVNSKDLSVFLWTKQNSYFVYSDKKTIAFGGGKKLNPKLLIGYYSESNFCVNVYEYVTKRLQNSFQCNFCREGYAITVDSNFLNGSSTPCITYGNSCLSTSPNFLIRHFQVWYFSDM